MKVLSYLSLVFFAVALVSCKSQQSVTEIARSAGETVIYQHCGEDEYPSTEEAFRACAKGRSSDQSIAKKKALNNARAELASQISVTVKTVSENYVKSTEVNNVEQALEQFEENSVNVVQQEITGAKTICRQLTKDGEGMYNYYVTLEVPSTKVLECINKNMQEVNSELVNYNYEKFKLVYKEELKKLNKE